jgi:hypothetical protein
MRIPSVDGSVQLVSVPGTLSTSNAQARHGHVQCKQIRSIKWRSSSLGSGLWVPGVTRVGMLGILAGQSVRNAKLPRIDPTLQFPPRLLTATRRYSPNLDYSFQPVATALMTFREGTQRVPREVARLNGHSYGWVRLVQSISPPAESRDIINPLFPLTVPHPTGKQPPQE